MKDWTGNNKAIYTCLGASNHALEDRQEEDYYATHPIATKLLLEVEPDLSEILEPCVGQGHLAEGFREVGKLKAVSDLVDRGYYPEGVQFEYSIDYLKLDKVWSGDIVTNPPYKHAKEFVEYAIEHIEEGRKVCMFLKVTFLEGKARKEMFKKYPPKVIYVCSGRVPCAKNGDFDKYPSSAVAYAWFVWEKGYKGDTVVKWIN